MNMIQRGGRQGYGPFTQTPESNLVVAPGTGTLAFRRTQLFQTNSKGFHIPHPDQRNLLVLCGYSGSS